MTTSLSSSLDMLSLTSSTRWASDSASDEDEIVWSLSSSEVLSSSSPLNSPLSETADFVLVPRVDTNTSASASAIATATATAAATTAEASITAAPATGLAAPPLPPPQLALTPDGIADEMAALSLSSASAPTTAPASACPPAKKKSRKKKGAGPLSAATAEPGVVPTPSTLPASAAPRGTPKRKKAKAHSPSSSSSSSAGGLSTAGHVVAQLPPPASALSSSLLKSDFAGKHDGLRSSSSCSPSSAVGAPPMPKRRAKKGAAAAAAPVAAPGRGGPTGLGLRTVVDDSLSEASGEERSSIVAGAGAATVGYHEAQKFMTSYLAHPPPLGNKGSALLVLQALILELGCLPNVAAGKFSIPELPGSLRQAKLILKSRAFINVRDYLAVREQGQAALRRVMHPSRKSLVQEVRKGKRVPVHEVKKAGLNVLLVNARS